MPFDSWRDAVQVLEEATGPATPEQLELARRTGVEVKSDTPRIIAAAQLRSALAKELYLSADEPVREWTKVQLGILQQATGLSCAPANEEEGEAWVSHLRLVQRLKSLEEQKPSQGDVVHTAAGEPAVISSIGEDGRVYFKGGRGFGAWPDQLSIVARAGDIGEAKWVYREAENWAAQRTGTVAWSSAKSQELSEFLITTPLSDSDIDELQHVIDRADDERPIQELLEWHTHLLAALVSGQERYCISKKRLGAEYVPDFMIGSVDSLGIYWVFVELETPRSSIYQKNGWQLGAATRKGVSQIVEWRGWVTENLAYARRRITENGLGLFDIRPNSEGVVLVGRRSTLADTKESARHELRESSRIHVHSYDWLIEALTHTLQYTGLPMLNRYLVSRPQTQ